MLPHGLVNVNDQYCRLFEHSVNFFVAIFFLTSENVFLFHRVLVNCAFYWTVAQNMIMLGDGETLMNDCDLGT